MTRLLATWATARVAALLVLTITALGLGAPLVFGQVTEDSALVLCSKPHLSETSRTGIFARQPARLLDNPKGTKGSAGAVPARVLELPSASPPLVAAEGRSGTEGRLSPQSSRPRLSPRSRLGILWSELASPAFLLGSFGPAIGDQFRGDPTTWRGGALGYGLRVGSNAGRLLLEGGLTHGLAAATRLDPRFHPKGHGSVVSRLRHGAIEALTIRTAGGARLPNVPRIAGTFGAVLAQQRWQYGRLRPGDAALSTALSMGIDVAVGMITELTTGP